MSLVNRDTKKRRKLLKETYKDFIDAAFAGELETIKAILNSGMVHIDGLGAHEEDDSFTALCAASEKGHLSVVQELIRSGADVNKTMTTRPIAGWDEETALQVACVHGRNIEVIQELLNAGADVNLLNSHGASALMLFLESCDIDFEGTPSIARLLLEAKCDVNVRANGTTALFIACDDDVPIEIFTMIVTSGADLAMTDSKGMTALHLCIKYGSSIEKIACLIMNGINVDAKNMFGETPLFTAVQKRNDEAVLLLLHNNADIFAGTNKNETALMEILRQTEMKDKITRVRLILAKMKPYNKLFLDLQNDKGWTALHFAARQNSPEIIHELLNLKPDLTRRMDENGWTALHICIQFKRQSQLDALRCLLEHENGYREHAINLQDYDGFTVLHRAMENNCGEAILQYLSSSGVDVSIADKKGQTSLHTAVRTRKSTTVILALLGSGHGANAANMQDCLGMTALHTAISTYGDDDEELKVVRALSQTTNVNAQDRYGRTALHYAVQKNRLAFLNMLLYEQKADLSLQDYEGNTPFSLACGLPMEKDCCQLSLILQLYQFGVAYGAKMV